MMTTIEKHAHDKLGLTLILLSFFLFLLHSPTAQASPGAYVQPTLLNARDENMAVVVTGADSQSVARAVRQAGGQITSNLWLIDGVGAIASPHTIAALAGNPAVDAIVANQTIATAGGPGGNNGQGQGQAHGNSGQHEGEEPDSPATAADSHPARFSGALDNAGDALVQALGHNPKIYDFHGPATVDVGAHFVHAGSAEHPPVTGAGVTVAVLDSGVYFDPQVRKTLGGNLQRTFVGQVDFVGAGQCASAGRDYIQHDGYCWTNHITSVDRYGHGSHVAGIIWNQFMDLYTGRSAGIAPGANILSVRVLGDNGIGTYEDVIEGLQFIVSNKEALNIRVLNVSLSAYATTPYFADPLNRAIEATWAQGITVVVAAGNMGPAAETITVPANDPYVITVGAVDGNQTAGNWDDDTLPAWSSAGPTQDGFVKPDVLAPGAGIVSFMYNDPADPQNSAYLAQMHPDYSQDTSMFRMSGTSTAAAVTSGVVALMLEANPQLTPDQVKYRLMASAKSAMTLDGEQVFSPLKQGAGRIWAPDAVHGDMPLESANDGMDIYADLAHPWHDGDSLDPEINPDLDFHYLGPVQRMLSDDGQYYLYFILNDEEAIMEVLGVTSVADGLWLDSQLLDEQMPSFNDGQWTWGDSYLWGGARYSWGGARYSWGGARYSWGGARYSWGGARYSWGGARYSWGGARYSWGGARYSWGGARYSWGGARYSWSGARYSWSGTLPSPGTVGATPWVDNK